MREGRKLIAWLIVLAVVHGIVACAGFFAPYSPSEQDREHPYVPPMKIHFVDSQGVLHLRPFIYALRQGSFEQYEEDRTETIALQFFTSGAEYRLFALIPCHWHLFGVSRSRLFLLGSDAYGRDLFSRILYGGQISVLAGLLAAALALFFGLFLGAVAGYYGGWRDHLLMRFAELFLALPWLYLLFALRAFLPLALSPLAAFFLIVTVIGAVGWARPARLVRGIVLSVKERDFVRAARSFGASDAHILRRHILPQTTSVVLTQAALLVPQFILAEVTLSFVGLGVPEPAPSWGNLLVNLQQYSVLVSYWWMYLPAAAMVPFFLGYLGLASSLQDYAAIAKIDKEAGRSRT